MSLSLQQLLQPWNVEAPDINVSGLSVDNRQIVPDTVFVALQGTQSHGLRYAQSAVEAGACAVLYQPVAGVTVPTLSVPTLALDGLADVLGDMAALLHGDPSSQQFIVGVTGTDGKTSVSHFIAQALNAHGEQAGVLGTLGIGSPGQLQAATHTTPDAATVQKRLADLLEEGFDSVIMEASSHALDQGRVNAVQFDIAVLTNLGRDHLDYHGSMSAYADAKRKLFQFSSLKHAVVNLDDAFGEELLEQAEQSGLDVLCYGIGEQDEFPENTLVASQLRFAHDGIHMQVDSRYGSAQVYAGVLGNFNVHNLLATLAVLLLKGLTLDEAVRALRAVQVVPGRMERLDVEASSALTVVDYAHTPGALEQVLKAVRSHSQRDLVCVFGCGGDRDRGKRPLMARVADQVADKIIVTDDNPRTEAPAQIFDDIAVGFSDVSTVIFEHDRAKAIRMAIKMTGQGDAVLIAGKGHETVQVFKDQTLAFDDREQALQALKEHAS